ncbi:hypothetical protein ABG812_09915 [Streptococcus iniae]
MGYINSSELWSKNNLGNTRSGDGHLSAYALLSESSFKIPKNSVRINYSDLRGINAFSDQYAKAALEKEKALRAVFSDNAKAANQATESTQKQSLSQAEAALKIAKENISQQEVLLGQLPAEQKEQLQDHLSAKKQNFMLRKKNSIREKRVVFIAQSQLQHLQ